MILLFKKKKKVILQSNFKSLFNYKFKQKYFTTLILGTQNV